MARSNDQWVSDLKIPQEAALVELREVLLRNLRRALAGHPRADDAFLEDAVQDAVLKTLDRLDAFEGRSRFITWATSIAIRIALGELRRSRWKDISLDETTSASLPQEEQPNAQPIINALYEVMRTSLTDRQRSALVAEMKGMPQDEIARHLGSNRNAIYKLTHDARRNLRRGLEAAGYSAGDLISSASHSGA